jgi:glycosyltransferase involved in cell wall biosynthesis
LAKVIYTGSFRFPDGDAAAARVLGIGKALCAAGHEVVFAGWEKQGRQDDLREDGFTYQGFSYFSQGDLPTSTVSPLRRVLRFIRYGQNTLRWLEAQDMRDVKAIIAYHGGSWFLSRLISLCRQQGIRLIVDCTEWYAAHSLQGGRFGVPYLDNEIRMRHFNVAAGRVIAISSYLERYYLQYGCSVLRVPPLVDLGEEKWQSLQCAPADYGVLSVVYAGTPAKKDLLGNALRGLRILRDDGVSVKLHLIGPTREAVARCLDNDAPILEGLTEMLIFHGRVSQTEVPKLLAAADFSVLLRPQERYAQAGFPTKLVESLAAGIPVIANPTSDIAEYVRDGIEGILLDDDSPTAFVAGVKRALVLSRDQRETMRRNARLRAEASFDYKGYVQQLSTFIHEGIS